MQMLEIENRKRGIGVGGVGWGRGGNVGRRWDVNVFFFLPPGAAWRRSFWPLKHVDGENSFSLADSEGRQTLAGEDGRWTLWDEHSGGGVGRVKR